MGGRGSAEQVARLPLAQGRDRIRLREHVGNASPQGPGSSVSVETLASSRLAQLLELLESHLPLQPAEVVDEQHAFEVVHLVLEAGGPEAVHLLFVYRAV